MKLEEKLAKLEKIANQLESDIPLEKALQLFEESVNFSNGVSFYPPVLCDREVRGISS